MDQSLGRKRAERWLTNTARSSVDWPAPQGERAPSVGDLSKSFRSSERAARTVERVHRGLVPDSSSALLRPAEMLHASKLQLQTKARQRMLEIRNRELQLYMQNARTLGIQASMLAGVAFEGLLFTKMERFQSDGTSWLTFYFYPVALTCLLGFSLMSLMNFNCLVMFAPGTTNPLVLRHAAQEGGCAFDPLIANTFGLASRLQPPPRASILSPPSGLALRGPDGSMGVAVDCISIEYRTAGFFLACSIFCAVLVLTLYAWADLNMHRCVCVCTSSRALGGGAPVHVSAAVSSSTPLACNPACTLTGRRAWR